MNRLRRPATSPSNMSSRVFYEYKTLQPVFFFFFLREFFFSLWLIELLVCVCVELVVPVSQVGCRVWSCRIAPGRMRMGMMAEKKEKKKRKEEEEEECV